MHIPGATGFNSLSRKFRLAIADPDKPGDKPFNLPLLKAPIFPVYNNFATARRREINVNNELALKYVIFKQRFRVPSRFFSTDIF